MMDTHMLLPMRPLSPPTVSPPTVILLDRRISRRRLQRGRRVSSAIEEGDCLELLLRRCLEGALRHAPLEGAPLEQSTARLHRSVP